MILGDVAIKTLIEEGRIDFPDCIEPLVNPASLNVRLGNTFLIPKRRFFKGVRLGDKMEYRRYEIRDGEEFCLMPGQFALATTKERFFIPSTMAAYVQGRSSIGRAGLTVQNAGYVDPGFHGAITLELKNETRNPIYLRPGYPVAQMIFEECTPVEKPYKGKYNGQIEATGSRKQQDKEARK